MSAVVRSKKSDSRYDSFVCVITENMNLGSILLKFPNENPGRTRKYSTSTHETDTDIEEDGYRHVHARHHTLLGLIIDFKFRFFDGWSLTLPPTGYKCLL